MSPPMWLYALLAVLGILLPWYFNLQFLQETGNLTDISAFISATMANAASSSIAMDVSVACVTFLVWMLPEARRLGMRHVWVYPLLTFGVAFAFAFPLFMLMRERALQRRDARAA